MNIFKRIACYFRGHRIFPLYFSKHIVLLLGEEDEVDAVCRDCGTAIKIKMKNMGGRIDYTIE